jgi:hypothetical protein
VQRRRSLPIAIAQLLPTGWPAMTPAVARGTATSKGNCGIVTDGLIVCGRFRWGYARQFQTADTSRVITPRVKLYRCVARSTTSSSFESHDEATDRKPLRRSCASRFDTGQNRRLVEGALMVPPASSFAPAATVSPTIP